MSTVGTTLFIVYDKPGEWSTGPMVLNPDAFSPEEWAKWVESWKANGQEVLTVEVTATNRD